MVDHRWNIEKAKLNALRKQLENAKKNNEHDKITSIAREIANSEKKLQQYLKDRD